MDDAKIEKVLNKIREAFKQAIDADEINITIDSTPDDIPGWDSLGHVAVGGCLESVFGVSLDVDELMEMEDIRSIVHIMLPKVS